MNIFLDDIRNPSDVVWIYLPKLPAGQEWTIVRNYNQFCDVIKRCMLDEKPVERISFDHDLADFHYGGEEVDVSGTHEKTGLECAEVLVDACLACDWPVPEFTIHSMNGTGAEKIRNMMGDIEKARKMVEDWAKAPHPWKRTT